MMHALGIISMILFTSCFIPQIIVILKTGNVSGISVWLWIMVVGGYTTGLFYVIWRKEPILAVSYAVGLVLALLTLALVFHYGRKK